MEQFRTALAVISEVMRRGAIAHPDNDWLGSSPEFHLARAEDHARPLACWRSISRPCEPCGHENG
jgi:hypothetical protein